MLALQLAKFKGSDKLDLPKIQNKGHQKHAGPHNLQLHVNNTTSTVSTYRLAASFQLPVLHTAGAEQVTH